MESLNREVTPKIRAEASAWLARLHGPQRDRRVEAGFKVWLHANAAHAAAFEQITEAWEAVGSVPSGRLSSMVRWDLLGAPRPSIGRTKWAAAAVIATLAVGSLFGLYTAPLTTEVGEQRIVTLEDGSRVYLNTASRMRVRYDRQTRRVELQAGEALFEIARQSDRPFVVDAGERQITALGTSFVVRREGDRLAVTLVEGKVAVSSGATAGKNDSGAYSSTRELRPGQRLTLTTGRAPAIDRPALERVMAWQRGLVILDSTRLADAVAELNRYSAVALEVSDPHAADLRVSGAFRAGDSLSFAQAIATTYRLEVLDREDKIVLSGVPHPTYQ